MKGLILFLVILSFLQATIIPLNLILVILLCRGFVKPFAENGWLAIGLGLLLSLLLVQPLGVLSLIYLSLLLIVGLVKLTPLSGHLLILWIVISLLLFANQTLVNLLTGVTPTYFSLLVEIVLVIPTFIILRLWEERFIVSPQVKLKLKN